ncbi:MAG TPA: hypothetical protein VFG76_07635 [Candidatus Polarisedimenticolia bacterium]|nr:hypothetical protein [Candidatus Polarisedimenticolia bacterium]
MDLLQKINESLEPLGGALFTDAFVEARRAAAAKGQAPKKRASEDSGARVAMAAMAAGAESSRRPAEQPKPSEEDSGQLQAEVEAFLKRDEPEGTEDNEVLEYLKERSGFDPTELE